MGSAANSYSGGTTIVSGTLQLEKDPILLAGATLGSGGLTMGSTTQDVEETLDLNGCPLTLSYIHDPYDNGLYNSNTQGYNGTAIIKDKSQNNGVTILTLNVPAGQPDVFDGAIIDSYAPDVNSFSPPHDAMIRLVKTGGRTPTRGRGRLRVQWRDRTGWWNAHDRESQRAGRQ